MSAPTLAIGDTVTVRRGLYLGETGTVTNWQIREPYEGFPHVRFLTSNAPQIVVPADILTVNGIDATPKPTLSPKVADFIARLGEPTVIRDTGGYPRYEWWENERYEPGWDVTVTGYPGFSVLKIRLSGVPLLEWRVMG